MRKAVRTDVSPHGILCQELSYVSISDSDIHIIILHVISGMSRADGGQQVSKANDELDCTYV